MISDPRHYSAETALGRSNRSALVTHVNVLQSILAGDMLTRAQVQFEACESLRFVPAVLQPWL